MDNFEFDSLKLENQLCFPLYAASKEVVKKYRPMLDELGLTYTQYITMMVLWDKKRISVKDLGEKLYLDSGTLTPLLKSLEKKGYLTRARCKEDERVLIVSITDLGMELKKKANLLPASIAKCINLEPNEAVELYRMLYKILNGM